MSTTVLVTPTRPIPRQVLLALSLIAADFALSLIQLLLFSAVSGTTRLATFVLLAAVYAAWLFGLYRRLNWLRWLTVVGAVVGLISLPWSSGIIQRQSLIPMPVYIVKYALFDVGALLLCLPKANAWFTRKSDT